MRLSIIQRFLVIWFCTVISMLTMFALCKLGGTMFNLSHPAAPISAAQRQEDMYDECLRNTNSHSTNNCNIVLEHR